MGWCNGSYIAEDLYNKIKKYVHKSKRKIVANLIYEIFSDNDADCWEEKMNVIKDSEYSN